MKNSTGNYGLPLSDSYANPGARQMAERLAERKTAETLNIKFNVHLDLNRRSPALLIAVLTSVTHGMEFILYHDKENYTIFIPKFRHAVCFVNGQERSQDTCKSAEEYGTRIKLGLMAYDHFFQLPAKLQDEQTAEVLQLQ